MPLYTSYSEETQSQIEEFLENTFGWDEDELVAFVAVSYTHLTLPTIYSV